MRRRVLAAVAALLALPCVALAATTYYVAPPASGGSDANSGSAAHPWATLQHAADLVGPGDTVLARAGSYSAFEVTTSGTSVAPITFAAYPDELVTIVTDVAGRGAGINIEGASWITIERFHIANRATVGIRAVLCDGVTLRGNVLADNGKWGILTGCCDDQLIEGNSASGSIAEHGIYVGNSGDRPVIRGNVIFGNHDNGIHMNGDLSVDCAGATANDGVISDAVVEGNTIFDNGTGGGSGINCDGVQTSKIRNNLIFASHSSGISLYRIDGGAPANGNRVENNTVLVASDGKWALNIQNGSQSTTVRNNILWSDYPSRGAIDLCPTCVTGFSSDYNAFENQFTLNGGNSVLTLTQWRTATSQDPHSFAIPNLAALFVDSVHQNFDLEPGVAAVNAGTTIGDLTVDIADTSRPQGPSYDIGAFEGENGLFGDGFENGSTVRWSGAPP